MGPGADCRELFPTWWDLSRQIGWPPLSVLEWVGGLASVACGRLVNQHRPRRVVPRVNLVPIGMGFFTLKEECL